MTAGKTFDCVQYKRRVQQKHAAEHAGLTSEQRAQRRAQWLAESDNPAARLWRAMEAKREPAAIGREGTTK